MYLRQKIVTANIFLHRCCCVAGVYLHRCRCCVTGVYSYIDVVVVLQKYILTQMSLLCCRSINVQNYRSVTVAWSLAAVPCSASLLQLISPTPTSPPTPTPLLPRPPYPLNPPTYEYASSGEGKKLLHFTVWDQHVSSSSALHMERLTISSLRTRLLQQQGALVCDQDKGKRERKEKKRKKPKQHIVTKDTQKWDPFPSLSVTMEFCLRALYLKFRVLCEAYL